MTTPPEFLEPLLMDIEITVVKIHEEFPKLTDKEVESAYAKLGTYFKKKTSGKEIDEPSHPIERCEALIDEILNTIDLREEADADAHLTDTPDYTIGGFKIISLNHLYVNVFKRLEKSARFWRKENGIRGYLNYIGNFLSST